MTLSKSLNYKPVELAFGTSGLRALVKDMTDLECYINTLGFINYLKESDSLEKNSEILLAGDLRDSTPRIMSAVVSAIQDSGFTPINCGLVPTPTAAYLGFLEHKACIIVTGSHIPADRNGIKYYKKEGEVLKLDETLIKESVAKVRLNVYRMDTEDSHFDGSGSSEEVTVLPPVDHKAERLYIERFVNLFKNSPLADKHIVVYQHSAVGRDMLVHILNKLGAKVTSYGRSEKFIPIDTENVTPANKTLFKKIASEYPDNFAIVSTDGDSDRPFVIDEKGEFYRGDILGCIVAKYLNADFAAVPISSNDATDIYCKQQGIKLAHTKIGSPYVISAMQETSAQYKNLVGWEVNGGFLIGSDLNLTPGTLTALPTRDAILPILCALVHASDTNQKVSTMFNKLPKRYTGGGLIEGVRQEKVDEFLHQLTSKNLQESFIKKVFKEENFGKIKQINMLDGLRIYFDSDDIVHIRPSGNAPQLRIYTNTASQSHSDAIVEEATKKDGLLESFINQF